MELVNYDKETKVSTIKISDEDLSLIVSVLGGVLATWDYQKPTVLGLTEDRMNRLDETVRAAFHAACNIKNQ